MSLGEKSALNVALPISFLGGSATLSSSSALHFSDYSFWSTTLLTGMTGISLPMQWPLTSQLHGSVSQREQWVFCYGSNSTSKGGSFLEKQTKIFTNLMDTCKLRLELLVLE
jgi:hypothetical protein